MPRNCCVPGCQSNYYTDIPLETIFSFPKDKYTREKWTRSINRVNFIPKKDSAVCINHFASDVIIKEDKFPFKDGSFVIVPRKRLKLQKDAIPTIFENHPTYLSKQLSLKETEVHFEDSQFESHRADGLRKLKPCAIPTIFNHDTAQRPKRKRKIFSSVSVQDADHSYLKQSEDVDDPESIVETHETYETKREPIRTLQLAQRGRRRGRPVKCKNADTEEWIPDQARAVRGRKRGRPVGSLNKITSSVSPTRKSSRISRRGRRKWALQEHTEKSAIEKEPDQKNDIQCYVCNKLVEDGTPLHTRTATTKVHMYQRLRRVVAGELELVVDEDEVLCPHCTRLLNYMDRIEVELNMLNKAILNCMRKKFGLGPAFEDKTHESALVDLEVQQDSPNTVEEMAKLNFNQDCKDEAESVKLDCHWIEDENDISDPINNMKDISGKTNDQDLQQNVCIKAASPAEEFQCRICMFKTFYKSVIVFHLRQHMKAFYRCDFCNVSLPQHSQRISRPESCHTEHILESSNSKNSEMYETQIQGGGSVEEVKEVSVEEVTASIGKNDQCDSNVITPKTINDTEISSSHSSEPQVLMTVVSHSSNEDELTVLNDTGMSVVRGTQSNAFSITLAYADTVCTESSTSSVPILKEKSTEAEAKVCQSVGNTNRGVVEGGVGQFQDTHRLSDRSVSVGEDTTTSSAENVLFSESRESFSHQTVSCEKIVGNEITKSSEVTDSFDSARDSDLGIVQEVTERTEEENNPDPSSFQGLKINTSHYDAKDNLLSHVEDWV